MTEQHASKPIYNKWGQSGKDYEEGINFDRLRRERLQKARESMIRHDLGAIVAIRGENARYLTGFNGLPVQSTVLRYVVLPVTADPVIFELGADIGRLKESATWMNERNIVPSIPVFATPHHGTPIEVETREKLSYLWADGIKRVLQEYGVADKKVGLDFVLDLSMIKALDHANIDYVEGQSAMMDARSVKTKDELQLLSIASQIAEAGLYTIERSMKPGIRECEVWAEAAKTMIALGADSLEGICTTGGRTNPYYRQAGTDKIMRPNDLLVTDIVVSYMGYHTCVVRTFLNGNKPTEEQKRNYREAYDSLYKAINAVKAGVTTDVVAEALPKGDWANYSLNIGHGLGLIVHETPSIVEAYSKDCPTEIKENMYIALETYAGDAESEQGVRLEENLAVTREGYEIFSRYPFDERLLD
jgi:Xaa-Pro aminopeptidase